MFIISFAILLFGFWLFGLAFTLTAFQAPVFFAGILCCALAYFIPVQLLRD
jgi:hypothetical protein